MPNEDRPLKYSENYYIRVLLNKVRLKEVMTSHIHCVNEKDALSRVEEKFRTLGIRHLPVADEGRKLVGLMTQRELFKLQSPRRMIDGSWVYDKETLDGYILKHVMIKDPATLGPETPVAEAVVLMAERKYGCIPIVDGAGVLCGIVTQIDILKLAARILREGAQEKGG